MNQIDELIAKHCPSGVEFLKIGQLAKVGTGSSDRKNAIESGEYPFYVRSKNVMRIDTFEFDEEAILIPGEGGVGEIFHYVHGKYALHQRAYRIHFTDSRVNTRFAYYYFNAEFKRFILQKAVSATVTSIRKPMITEFKFPVPPLEVQRAIVDILDKFTALEAELEAELEARKQQYDYYRNQLLKYDEKSIPFSNLGDIYKFQYGNGNTIPAGEGQYPVYGSNGIVGSYEKFNSEDAPVIGHIGAYAGIVNWAEGKHFVTYNGVICTPKNGLSPRFGYHLLKNQNFRALARDGSQPFVSYDKLNNVQVQIPSVSEQVQVAKVLDKFEALVSDISSGLPGEITARRQQYEYYRDELLTFKELAS